MADATLAILIRAKDEASGTMKALSAHTSDLSSKMKSLAVVAAGAFAGFASVSALSGAIGKTQELGEATRTLSMQTGISAETSSRWIFTLEHVGMKAEDAEKSLGILAKGIFNNSEVTKNALDTIGVSARDSAGNIKSMDVLLPELSTHFANAADSEAKTALAMDLFGKSGKDMLPFLNLGADEMGRLAAEADKLGITLSGENVAQIHQYTVAQRELEASIEGVKVKIGLALMPTLAAGAEGMVHLIDRNQEAIRSFTDGVPGAIEVTIEALTTFAKGANSAATGAGRLIGISDDIAAAAVPLALAFAFLFPQGALIVGIAAVHESFTIMDSDVSTASDSALAFESAWLKAISGILGQLNDLENAINDLNPFTLFGNIDLGDTAAKKAQDAVDQKRQAISGEQALRGAFGGLGFGLGAKLMSSPEALADFNAWNAAAGDAKKTTHDFADALSGSGGGGVGGLTAAEKAAQQGLIDMALAFADFHAATGLGEQDFMALIKMSEDRSDMDKRATEAGIGLKVAQLEASDAGFQLQKALVGIAEDAVKSGRTLTQEMAHIWEGIVGNIRSAFNGLFSRPTREGAQLDLEIALQEEELARRRAAGASDEETKSLQDNISVLGRRKDVLDKHADVLKAQLEVADATLITEQERDTAAKLYTIALGSASAQLDQASALVSLQGIAQANYISALGNAAQSLGSSQSAADPFNAAQKHWINGVAHGKGESEPFPGFKTGGRVTKTGIALVHADEIITPAGKAPAGGNTYHVYIQTYQNVGDAEAGIASLGAMV